MVTNIYVQLEYIHEIIFTKIYFSQQILYKNLKHILSII
jgi:hypothetical protein